MVTQTFNKNNIWRTKKKKGSLHKTIVLQYTRYTIDINVRQMMVNKQWVKSLGMYSSV